MDADGGAPAVVADWWKMKYEKTEEQYRVMKGRNEELEERMLNLVDKVEQEKVILSNEIDELAGRLAAVNGKVTLLEGECARYKKDCILAVNLLHCYPGQYIQRQSAPTLATRTQQPLVKSSSKVCGVATFPPMAAYLPDEPDLQPEDPVPDSQNLGTLKTSPSFTSEFVEKIKNDQRYSCVNVLRCSNCDTVRTSISRAVQTAEPQPPWPKIVDLQPTSCGLDLFDETVF